MTERELDQLLDAALPDYVAEAPDGLAGRVVERALRRRVWPWAAGLAAAAGLAVAMVALQGSGEVAAPPLVVRAPRAPEVRVVVQARRAPVRRSPARPGVDRGLTPREARLLRFVQANPELARQVFVEAPLRMAEPVAVAPLEVAPISIEPLAASGGEEN